MNFGVNENNRWAAFSEFELNTILSSLESSMNYLYSREKENMIKEIRMAIAKKKQFLYGGITNSNY